MICLLGVYSVRNNFFDVWVMILAGIVGVIFRRYHYPVAPLIIGLILGPMTENNLRKTMMLFRGDLSNFLNRPIALSFLSLVSAIIIFRILYYLLIQERRRLK